MIGQFSRYARSILYKDGVEEFIGTRHKIVATEKPDDRFYTSIDGDRLDILANRFLGRSDLWWIICDYNDIFFPLELEPGTVLRIPSRDHTFMRILG